VYEYQPSMMHAKTMLIDDRLVVVGSINMDFLSMEFLDVGCLVADDPEFAAALEERWREDLALSRQVVGERVAARTPSAEDAAARAPGAEAAAAPAYGA
jgi:cardiolipin synthase